MTMAALQVAAERRSCAEVAAACRLLADGSSWPGWTPIDRRTELEPEPCGGCGSGARLEAATPIVRERLIAEGQIRGASAIINPDSCGSWAGGELGVLLRDAGRCDNESIGATMPADDQKRSIHRALVNRILHGPGRAPADQRARAFDDAELPESLRPLVEKVATRSAHLTDADFAVATEAGFTDDQLFELVICAAVGESTRQYEAGLAALSEATADPETA